MICVGLFAEDKITGVPTGHGLFGGQSHDELRVSRDKEEIEGLDLGEHGMEAPFLAMSSPVDEWHKLHAIDAGAADFLTKPFLPEELLA